ncbi:MAG: hypothetical protein U0M06_05075 [Clostridia bacterium]|nr:hypothetical protein [Clostridia bacterium]
MKLWQDEKRQYFATLKEAKLKAEYEDSAYRKFNGIHYDGELGKYYVSYVYKY